MASPNGSSHLKIKQEPLDDLKTESVTDPESPSESEEDDLEQLQEECDALKKENEYFEQRSKTQTGQVIGCERKVTKVTTELAQVKAAAQENEVHYQRVTALLQTERDALKKQLADSNARAEQQHAQDQSIITGLHKSLDDHKKLIRRSNVNHSMASLAYIDKSCRDWGAPVSQLQIDMTTIKATLLKQEGTLSALKAENRLLRQMRQSLENSDQDLKRKRTSIDRTLDGSKSSVTRSNSGEMDQNKRLQRAPVWPHGLVSGDARPEHSRMSDEQAIDWLNATIPRGQASKSAGCDVRRG